MEPLFDPQRQRLGTWLLLRAFVGATLGAHDLDSYLAILVRSTDMACLEYIRAREAHLCTGTIQDDGSQVLGFLDATAHLEFSILATRRALRALDRIRSNKAKVQIGRLARKRLESAVKQLVAIRDTIEHVDDVIRKGELRNGLPHSLTIRDEQSASIGRYTLDLRTFRLALCALYDLCVDLVPRGVPVSASPKASADVTVRLKGTTLVVGAPSRG